MTIYYVATAANGGSDAANGTSTGTPWATVAKVNGSTFNADDQILFNRGDTWAEKLTPPSSGTSGHPIIFGAYGTGANPIFNKTSSQGIAIPARSYITFQDIDLTNTGTASNGANIIGSGTWTGLTFQRMALNSASDYNILQSGSAVTSILVDNITMATSSAGERIRFSAAGNSDVTISNVTTTTGGTASQFDLQNISNLTLTNVTVVGGAITIALVSITGTLNMTSVTVSGSTATGMKLTSCTATVTATGLTLNAAANCFWALTCAFGAGSKISNSSAGNPGTTPWRIDGSSNLELISCTATSGTASNGFLAIGAWSTLAFTSCTATSNGLDGFRFDGSGSVATLTGCIADSNLQDGFSLSASSTVHDVTCTNCIAKNNGVASGTSSGDGFTSHNTTYNFNIYYCIAYGNTQSGFAHIETSQGTIYNCVAYNNGWASGNRGGIYIGITGNNATTGTSWTIKNCIISSNTPVELKTIAVADYNLLTLDYNNYYHPANSNVVSLDNLSTFQSWTTYHTTNSHETNSVYGDPLFFNPPTDFHLTAGSPSIDTGVNVSLTGDYLGNRVPRGGLYDMGAIEYGLKNADGLPSGTLVKTYNGLAFASVKSVNGQIP